MESLFNERLQVRTRHLEERVGALSKQLATQKEHNAHLHRSHADATHKAQLLEEDLQNERERCHKLAVTLSASRRYMKNKSSRDEEGRYCNTFEPAKSPRSHSVCPLCGGCICMTQTLHHANGETVRTDHNNESLPNYMGIMPARLNRKLLKSKKTAKFVFNNDQIAHHDRQILTARGSKNSDSQSRCVNCCCDVEVLLARRLRLYDLVQQDHFIDVCKKQDPFQEPLSHNVVGGNHEHHQSGSLKWPVDAYGKRRHISSNVHTLKNSANAKPMEQDLSALRTLSREGYYVRMEIAQSEHQQSCSTDKSAAFVMDPSINARHDYDDLPNLQFVQALKAENEALRGALLSTRKVEIEELESELQEIKQTALSTTTSLVPNQSTRPTKAGDCATMSNVDNDDDDNVRSEWSQMDPVKFLDALHKVEDKILEKKIGILGLECCGAALESGASVLVPF
ncbi:hypothetical protein GOP47_0003840 [Adiantum capillus-veneris]|uniref:Uncharacterized protein n=1 Tax=Adiantum capillus-veneris TaxID=13818 RepID=A0A9D4V716_ADICA|nr:hypothetical protein GOP47_0003840 [Adiantum capillus-veneris]